METNLHRSLKLLHASGPDHVEVQLGSFRIDAVDAAQNLVEIQLAGLGAIRKKIVRLCKNDSVRVIKPIIANKRIETLNTDGASVRSSRRSPKHGTPRDLFRDLIHFTEVFPHENLQLEILLVDVVERRIPRKRRGWRKKQYKVVDLFLDDVGTRMRLTKATDLWRLADLPRRLKPFDTSWLAEKMDAPRWFAQQVAYVLQRCGTVEYVGKVGNNKLYQKLGETKPSSTLRKRA